MPVDPTQYVVDLLKDNWNDDNTGTNTPTIQKVWERQSHSLVLATPGKSLIAVYETTGPYAPSGIGSREYRHTPNITLDLRSVDTEEEALKVKEEILRILDTKKSEPGGDFQKIMPPFEVENVTDKGRNVFRYIIKFQLMTWRRALS